MVTTKALKTNHLSEVDLIAVLMPVQRRMEGHMPSKTTIDEARRHRTSRQSMEEETLTAVTRHLYLLRTTQGTATITSTTTITLATTTSPVMHRSRKLVARPPRRAQTTAHRTTTSRPHLRLCQRLHQSLRPPPSHQDIPHQLLCPSQQSAPTQDSDRTRLRHRIQGRRRIKRSILGRRASRLRVCRGRRLRGRIGRFELDDVLS